MKKINSFYSILALLLLSNLELNAWTFTWTGSTSTSWTDAGNWNRTGINTGSNTVPGSLDDVEINISTGNQPVLQSSTTILNLSQSAGVLNFSNFTLTITNNASFTGGSLLRGTLLVNDFTNMQNTIFDANNSQFIITKTGGSNNDLYGSNTFKGQLKIINSSSSRFRLAVNAADSYTGLIFFNENGSGDLEPAYNFSNFFPRSISTQNSTNVVSFSMGSGSTVFNGITTLLGDKYYFNRLVINTTQAFTTLSDLSINELRIMSGRADGNSNIWTVNNLSFTGGSFEDGTIDFLNLDSMQNTTFLEGAYLNKVGGGDNIVAGGNVFNGSVEIKNSSSNLLRLSATTGDDYNSTITFLESSSGQLEPAYSGNNNFAADINIFFSNEISFGLGGGWFIVDGNQPQKIIGSVSNPPKIKNLRLNTNNSMVIQNPVYILNSIDFVNGYLISNVNFNQLLILNDNISIVTSPSNSSHVNGPVVKIGDDAFTFPVGNGTLYAPISISAPSTSTDQFTAQYFGTVYPATNVNSSLDHVSVQEHWILNRTFGFSNVQVKLSFNSSRSGLINNLNDLRVSRYNGSSWESTGNANTTGSNSAGTVESNSVISNFSPFTIGSTSGLNPLPVSLISFNAIKNNDNVLVKWNTSNESNNDYFTVEKSFDGIEWNSIGVLKGAENSNVVLNYELLDFDAKMGIQFYRLRQTDLSGRHTYSKIVNINFSKEINNFINLYPQPVTGFLNISLPSNNDENASIAVYNAFGVKVLNLENLSGLYHQIDLNKLINGVYIIELNIDGLISQRKIIKQ